MKLPKSLVVLLAGTAVAATLPVLAAMPASAAVTPPWEPDPNAAGSIVFYDASGNVLTSGADLSHIADFAAASGAKQDPGVTKATLFFAAPDHIQPDTSTWTTLGAVTASTSFPNAAAPNPIKGPGFTKPLVTIGTGGNLTAWYGGVTHDSTAGYAGLVQVRILESGPGGVQPAKFWSADISVDTTAGTWTEVYPVAGSTATPTATALSVTPASPVVGGTAETLKATMTPSGAVGSVQFFDGTTSLGTAAVTAGVAQLVPLTLSVGTHSLTAKFTPADVTAFSPSTSAATAYVVSAPPATYTPVTPCRVFDTRSGAGACANAPSVPVAKLGAGGVLSVKITGVGSVPPDATAVVLNVTAVGATVPGTFVAVYPAAPGKPTSSNLNVNSSAPVPNLVIVPVGAGGLVDFYNNAGTVNLIADVAGYFSPTGGSLYTPTGPCRLFDTRIGSGTCTTGLTTSVAKVAEGGVLKVKVTGANGVPDNATAVVVNITAVGASIAGTFVSAYPDSPTRPTVSNLNINNASPVPNLAVIPVGPGGLIDFYNNRGTINLIGDLAGYFAPAGAQFTPTGPCRVFDTRTGTGLCAGANAVTKAPVGAGAFIKVKVTGVGGVPANATAVVLNVTAVAATSPGTFVTVYPDPTRPTASNLNVNNAGPIPNLVVVPVGPGGFVDFYNNKGTVNLIADVSGYFAP